MRGLKRLRSARVSGTGHAFVQNLRRGHYELGVDADSGIDTQRPSPNSASPSDQASQSSTLPEPIIRQRNKSASTIGRVRKAVVGTTGASLDTDTTWRQFLHA